MHAAYFTLHIWRLNHSLSCNKVQCMHKCWSWSGNGLIWGSHGECKSLLLQGSNHSLHLDGWMPTWQYISQCLSHRVCVLNCSFFLSCFHPLIAITNIHHPAVAWNPIRQTEKLCKYLAPISAPQGQTYNLPEYLRTEILTAAYQPKCKIRVNINEIVAESHHRQALNLMYFYVRMTGSKTIL